MAAVFFNQQRRDVTVVQFERLLIDTVRFGEEERHIGRVVGRGKGVVEGSARQLREDCGVGDRGCTDGHGLMVTNGTSGTFRP